MVGRWGIDTVGKEGGCVWGGGGGGRLGHDEFMFQVAKQMVILMTTGQKEHRVGIGFGV